MEFSLVKLVSNETPSSCYRLHVKSMSGDADLYQTATRDIRSEEELEKLILLFDAFFDLDHNSQCDYNSVVSAIEEKGEELGFEYPTDEYGDLTGYDVIYQGNFAKPNIIWVTWFNEYGEEYEVSFDYKGERVTKIARGY